MIPSYNIPGQCCENPFYDKKQRKFFNCGKCDYCRKLWLSDWSKRLQMQKELSQYTICATLTYNNEHLPFINGVPSLSKEDIQKFFKRVRKYLSSYYKDCQIQYFISGEYGSSFLRPHYHLIMFVNTDNRSYTQYDFQTIMLDKWQKGFIQFMPNNNMSISYLAKYIGKTTGISEHASQYNLPLPFVLMSRRPAIGAKYLEVNDNFELHFKNPFDDKIHLFGMGQMRYPSYIYRKISEHWLTSTKEKLTELKETKQQLKFNDYEHKIKRLANSRNHYHFNQQNLCSGSKPILEQREREQRLKKNFVKARQIEDINYINLKKK